MNTDQSFSEEIKRKIKSKENLDEVIAALNKLPDAEIAESLKALSNEDLITVLSLFPVEKQGRVFAEFDMPLRLHFFQHVSKKWFARMFEKMPSDDRADTFQQLNTQERVTLLPYLQKVIREDVLRLSAYAHDTAGGVMSTDFAMIKADQSCAEALKQIRQDDPEEKMLFHLYVVDDQTVLHGYMTLKDLVIADPNEIVRGRMRKEPVSADLDEDRETVAAKIEKYELLALPVLNEKGQLMGIVHQDDAIEVIRQEQTEDMEKFMGIIPGSEILNYNQTTAAGHFRKRVTWLAILTVVGFVSGMIIQRYEAALSALMILALFIPMVADTGGNSGSQAATVVIRAMALGQVSIRNWFGILAKEARISLMLAGVLGVISFFMILILTRQSDFALPYSPGFTAFGISLALSVQVITATMLGAGLPLLVKRFDGDPAIAASPAITTVVDITGLLIYFGMATLLFF